MWGHTPRREASGETSPADTSISDSSLQDWERIDICCQLLGLRCSVTAALANPNAA